ncbi:hypothetical protein PTKIN_Ptkin04bG0098600 [Pterospermum kingtungense]
MERVRVRLGFENCFVVDSLGPSAGLALLWEEDVDLSVQSYTRYHIDSTVKLEAGQPLWRFKGFYGEPAHARRMISWDL